MSDPDISALGPLAALAGTWEGEQGADVSPDPGRGVGKNPYRERLVLEPMGEVGNHEQVLQALRYSTVAWPIGEADPFHEELGYWLWDAANKQAMRSFMVPRGMTILAGATVEPDASEFSLAAELGSATYGICSNPFLDAEFQTVRYDLNIRVLGPDSFAYDEDLQIRVRGQDELFHHTDRNTLQRVG